MRIVSYLTYSLTCKQGFYFSRGWYCLSLCSNSGLAVRHCEEVLLFFCEKFVQAWRAAAVTHSIAHATC